MSSNIVPMQKNSSKTYYESEVDTDSMVSIQEYSYGVNSGPMPMVSLVDYLALYQKIIVRIMIKRKLIWMIINFLKNIWIKWTLIKGALKKKCASGKRESLR